MMQSNRVDKTYIAPLNPKKERVLIITHYDVDGIASAAIVLKKHPNADLMIARPHDISKKLIVVLKNPPDRIYILDIALNDPKARERIEKLAKKARVSIIDHHPHYPHFLPHLFTHSTSKSTSQLTSMKVKRDRYLAALAAQDARLFREVRGDSELLNYALRCGEIDDDFRIRVARELAKGLKVSQIPKVVEAAERGKKKLAEILEMAKEREVSITPIFSVAPIEVPRGFGGMIAGELTEDKKIVIVMSDEKGKTMFAARKPKNIPIDVGRMINKVCAQLGGEGGGHPFAAGGSIPSKRKKEFIKLIAEYIRERIERKHEMK
jgi:single-stranded DNA-specific DHH superfamily exonuclease